MTPSIRNTLSLLALLPAALVAQQAPAPSKDNDVVELEKLKITASKEQNFSLPLDAVTGTGSRLGLSVRDLPVSVSVVSQDVMQARGLRTAMEAVESAVGMAGGIANGSIPYFSTRGFGVFNNVTVMRDGIRQNTASQSARPLDSFLLDRVEILKGPASLMFGEGAVGGAINYVSKSPDRKQRGEVVASAGFWDSYRLGVGMGGPVPGFARKDGTALFNYRFDVSLNSTQGYNDLTSQDFLGLGGSFSWRPSPKVTLTYYTTWLEDSVQNYYGNVVLYDAVVNTTIPNAKPEVRKFVSATDRMINARIEPAARRTNYNSFGNYVDTENSFNRLRAEVVLSPFVEFRNEAYVATQLVHWISSATYTWNPATKKVDRSGYSTIYRDDVLLGDRLDFTFKQPVLGKRNRFVVGSSFEHNDQRRGVTPGNVVTALPSVTLLNPDVGTLPAAKFQKTSRTNVETIAFFAEDVLDLTPALKLVAGLRYDHITVLRDTLANPTVKPAVAYSQFRDKLLPLTGRAGLVWAVKKNLNAYTSISTAAEPVTQLVDYSTNQADFSLQKGRQIEVGLKGTYLNDRLDFTFAAYDIEKNDLLTSTLDVNTGLRISQQIGAQTSQGFEAALAVSPAPSWRIELNAAYTDARYADFNENLGSGIISRKGNHTSNIPEWIGNLFVSKKFSNGLTLSGGPRYVGERFANTNNSVVAEAAILLDAAASYSWKRYTITLRGRNLLDAEYEAIAGTTQRILTDPPSAELSVKYAF